MGRITNNPKNAAATYATRLCVFIYWRGEYMYNDPFKVKRLHTNLHSFILGTNNRLCDHNEGVFLELFPKNVTLRTPVAWLACEMICKMYFPSLLEIIAFLYLHL